MNRLEWYDLSIFCLSLLLCLAGCSSGGHSGDAGAVTELAPTVDGACSGPACPEPVDCRSYRSPESGHPVSIDLHWRERLDLCCGLRLCEVAGECRWGCPPELLQPGCPGAR